MAARPSDIKWLGFWLGFWLGVWLGFWLGVRPAALIKVAQVAVATALRARERQGDTL